MFCEKCGTKNEKDSNFCVNCGFPMVKEVEVTKTSSAQTLKDRFNSLSKKTKVIMGVVLIIVIVALIALGILLHNPVKRVEDCLESYYQNYSENSDSKELEKIGDILKSNKNNGDVLEDIQTAVHNLTDKWVKNFNTSYKDYDDLDDAYDKVVGAIYNIYDYYNGLEYMIDYELYNEYDSTLTTLYYSKKNYLQAKEYAEEDNDYYAYYYYQKVDETDSYYEEAQEFVLEYVNDELASVKKHAEEYITSLSGASEEEMLEAYIEELEYLLDNQVVHNIDLSDVLEYKNLCSEVRANIVLYTKKVVEAKAEDKDYTEAIKVIDQAIWSLDDKESDEYKELEELKEKYEDLMPISLLEKYVVSSSTGSNYSTYGKTIADKDYDSYISFTFLKDKQYMTYRLDKDYKTFKTTIVRGDDWEKGLEGYFVIYGDDKELYKSDKITKSSKLDADIEIDVTGVNELKIEFVTNDEASSYIYLVEPYLYK